MTDYISSADLNGIGERTAVKGQMAYYYGLSDFWLQIFADQDLVDSLLEVSTQQLGDVYGQFLQRAGNISLSTIQESYNSQLKLFLFSPSDAVDGLTGSVFKLPEKVTNISFIMNRPMLPSISLSKGVHFEINEDFTEISFYKPLAEMGFPQRVTEAGVTQFALWASNVCIDENIIYSQFGRAVGMTPDRAIGNYKDFVNGLYFLYSHGPVINYMQAGVNLALGIPTVRANEKVMNVLQNPINGHWEVLTATNFYDIPYGFQPDIAEGDVLTEGTQLVNWVDIKDYQKSGEWWYNTFIPAELTGGVQYPPVQPNTDMAYIMRQYLRYNTFMVLFQQTGVDMQGYYTVSDVIWRARPSHTFPVFVWRAPMGDEIAMITDEDFEMNQRVDIEDNIYDTAIIDFVRGDKSTYFDRGTNFYNRFQIPVYHQGMLGDAPKLGEFRGRNADGTALSGIGGWVEEAGEDVESDIRRIDPVLSSRGSLAVVRGRSTGLRGKRGSDTAGSSGLVRTYLNAEGDSLDLDTRNIVPLYLCHKDELTAKLAKINLQSSVALVKQDALPFWAGPVALQDVYDDIIVRTAGTTAKDYDATLEKVFTFDYTNEYVPPILSKHAGQMYVPRKADLPVSGKLLFAEIFQDNWSVSLVIEQADILPTYFPVNDGDPIEMTLSFEQKDGTSPITRGTYLANAALTDARAVQDGHYQDGRGGANLKFDRSGNFGGDLKAIIRRD